MMTVALIEKGVDGTYSIYTPELESTIIGEGNSVVEAKADFENSLREVQSMFPNDNELQNLQFEYKYDVPSVFNHFDCINITKFSSRVGINASLMRQYSTGKTYISERQAKRIENSLHDLAHQLLSVTL